MIIDNTQAIQPVEYSQRFINRTNLMCQRNSINQNASNKVNKSSIKLCLSMNSTLMRQRHLSKSPKEFNGVHSFAIEGDRHIQPLNYINEAVFPKTPNNNQPRHRKNKSMCRSKNYNLNLFKTQNLKAQQFLKPLITNNQEKGVSTKGSIKDSNG